MPEKPVVAATVANPGGLQPIGSPNAPVHPMADPPRPKTEDFDPVSDFLEENPNGIPDDAAPALNTPPANVPPLEVDDSKLDAEPQAKTDAVVEAKATETTTKTPDAPEAKKPDEVKPPEAAAKPVEPVAATPPAEPLKPSLQPHDPIELAPGVVWTRAQVEAGLRERATLQPQAAERKQLLEFFGYEKPQEIIDAWKPVLDKMRDPQMGRALIALMQAGMDSPDALSYLAGALDHYQTEMGTIAPRTPIPPNATQPQVAAHDPVIVQQMKDLQARLDARDATEGKRQAQVRFDREFAEAESRFPILKTDADLRTDLIRTASWMWNEDKERGVPLDQRRGLRDAGAFKARQYDDIARARNLAAPVTPPAAAPAATPNLSTNGAAPEGTRSTRNDKPAKFDSLDAATAAWLAEHPA
jgi:hypothetical protein